MDEKIGSIQSTSSNGNEEGTTEAFKTTETVETTKTKVDVKELPKSYFTVTILTKQGPRHLLVKALTALDALIFTTQKEQAPVVGVNITEYSNYRDSTTEEENLIERI
jgi:hypothetical protein